MRAMVFPFDRVNKSLEMGVQRVCRGEKGIKETENKDKRQQRHHTLSLIQPHDISLDLLLERERSHSEWEGTSHAPEAKAGGAQDTVIEGRGGQRPIKTLQPPPPCLTLRRLPYHSSSCVGDSSKLEN